MSSSTRLRRSPTFRIALATNTGRGKDCSALISPRDAFPFFHNPVPGKTPPAIESKPPLWGSPSVPSHQRSRYISITKSGPRSGRCGVDARTKAGASTCPFLARGSHFRIEVILVSLALRRPAERTSKQRRSALGAGGISWREPKRGLSHIGQARTLPSFLVTKTPKHNGHFECPPLAIGRSSFACKVESWLARRE